MNGNKFEKLFRLYFSGACNSLLLKLNFVGKTATTVCLCNEVTVPCLPTL